MTASQDLRTLVLSDAAITALVGQRCYTGFAPETADPPYIALLRRATADIGSLDPEDVPWQQFFDLEIVADVSTNEDLAKLVRDFLNGHSGAMGSGVVNCIVVRDQGDDYEPKNLAADERAFTSALDVELVNYRRP